MFREKIRMNFSQLTEVAIMAFFVTMTFSLTSPVFPVFAEKIYGGPEGVGIITAVFGLSAIFINFYIMNFFEKWEVLKNLRIGLILFSFVFASYTFINSTIVLVLAQIVLAAAVCLCTTALSILVNNSSKKKNLGGSEGKYFTVMNLGMFLGILNGGIIAKSYSYTTVFSCASLFFLGIYAISGSMGLKETHIKRKESESSIKNAIAFFSDAKLRKIFVSNLGLYFWSFVAFLYLPIILMSFGFNFDKIGVIFAIMIVPYILLEYPIGRLAEKEGSRKYIFLGFFAIALTSFLIYVNYGAINSMILFFFLASMGAAAIEPLNEMELDKHSKKSNIVENLSIFKTSLRIAQFLGPLSAAAMISLFGMREMFLVLAVIMAGFLLLAR